LKEEYGMTGIVFWDVDTQYDFIYPDGKLYVRGSDEIVQNLERLTRYARKHGVQVIGEVDYHSFEDEEISEKPDFSSTFPPHCIAGTAGQRKIEATKPLKPLWIDFTMQGEDLEARVLSHKGEIFFRHRSLDVFSNPNVDRVLNVLKPAEIVLYGVALDYCDAYAIDGLLDRGYRVYLVTDAVKPIRKERSVDLMARWIERGVQIVTTTGVVEGIFNKDLG
jgi:nicotinamidase/pyrazinamidase